MIIARFTIAQSVKRRWFAVSEPFFADAEHPGTLDMEEALAATDAAREWYNDAIPYAARIMWEATQESGRVRQVFLDFDSPVATALFKTMHEETPEKLAELHSIGLSMNQGATAEQMVAHELSMEDER